MPLHVTKTMTVDTTTDATCSNWVVLNQFAVPFNVSFGGVIVAGGPLTWGIEHTFQDVMQADASTRPIYVFAHGEVTAAGTAADGNYAFPVGAVRLKITGATSGGTVQVDFRQSGN